MGKAGMVLHACNDNAGEVRAGRSLRMTVTQPCLLYKCRIPVRDPLSKTT